MPAVATEKRVPANGEHINEHLNAVAHHVDLGGGRMRPAHGNFGGRQAMVARQVEQFGVKPEAFDALLFKNDAASFTAKRLEATLGVHEWKPQNDSNDAIENDSGKFAKE